MAPRRGLGKGLDSMIPKKKKEVQSQKTDAPEDKSISTSERLHTDEPEKKELNPESMVKINLVEPNRKQPRKEFQEDALTELSESIKQYGVLQPLLVSDRGSYYEIIAGERRWRAAKMAGLKTIPVIVKEYNEQEIVEISLIENIQREDLNAIEEANAYRRLIEEFDMKQDEVAERVSKSRSSITNSMRLLKLDDKVQQMLIEEMLTAGHARALLAVTDPEQQVTLATKIFDENLSVRDTEKLVKKYTEEKDKKPEEPKKQESAAEQAVYENLEQRMTSLLGTRVQIMRKRNHKGRIEIEYYSREELERIIDLLQSVQE